MSSGRVVACHDSYHIDVTIRSVCMCCGGKLLFEYQRQCSSHLMWFQVYDILISRETAFSLFPPNAGCGMTKEQQIGCTWRHVKTSRHASRICRVSQERSSCHGLAVGVKIDGLWFRFRCAALSLMRSLMALHAVRILGLEVAQ